MRKIITTLLTAGALFAFPANAGNLDLTGAWRGPHDLVVDVCVDNQDQQYICSCCIPQMFVWGIVSKIVSPDSLIMTSTDTDSPFEGRFRIESAHRLVGMLNMGNPDDAWYYNSKTELVKQMPIMPENLNHDLEGIILPSDYGVLSLDRDKAWGALSAITRDSYGFDEKEDVENLLNAKVYSVTPEDMLGFRRVRSIQIAVRDGIFSYPYFRCRFKKIGGKIFFEKTTGSQRKSGYLYQNSPESLVFTGGWSVNDDPQTEYGSENSTAGTVYRIGKDRAIMIFPTDSRVEIYELTK